MNILIHARFRALAITLCLAVLPAALAEEQSRGALPLRAHPIADLTADWPGDARAYEEQPPQDRADELADLVKSIVQPDEWADVGGRGEIDASPETLDVANTEETHYRVSRLLAALRWATEPDRRGRRVNSFDVEWAEPPSPALERALAQPVLLTAREHTLAQVAADLGRQAGVTIVFDHQALDDVGLKASDPLRFDIGSVRVPLRAALDLICSQSDVTWQRDGGRVELTTPEEARLVVRVYPVRDLCRTEWSEPTRRKAVCWGDDSDTLIELLTTLVSPTEWDSVGGAGSMHYFRGALVVSTNDQVHDDLERFIATLREVRSDLDRHPNSFSRKGVDVATPGESATRSKLDGKVTLAARQQSLVAILRELGRQAGVQVVCDHKALRDIGFDPETSRFSCNVRDVALIEALDELLSRQDLGFSVGDGYLWITAEDEVLRRAPLRLYPVRDLTRDEPRRTKDDEWMVDDHDSLIDLLETFICPNNWTNVGGPYDVEGSWGLLAVCQTEREHRAIENLLAGIRAAQGSPGRRGAERVEVAIPQWEEGGEYPARQLTIYQLARDTDKRPVDYDRLIDGIVEDIEPDSWSDAGGWGVIGSIERRGVGLLLVENRPEVQQAVGRRVAAWRRVNGR